MLVTLACKAQTKKSKGQSDIVLGLSTTKQHKNVYMLLMQCACGMKAPARQYQSTASAHEGAPHGP